MKTTLKAALLAATVALPSASAVWATTDTDTMAIGQSMLVGALVNSLSLQSIDSAGIEKLTLTEIVQLRQILSDDDTNTSTMRQQASDILDAARAR
ncbi:MULTISPECIES: hypothetical protein [unclassified Meridianimarinicoccus]|uniref:hypothetical protein n=1 Tax=unclassified Meridianimarinicoccus TaxID=2923344 RepID=UPI001867297F|nr:hypothetical protein [Fluviibacterium sp. MJW13]